MFSRLAHPGPEQEGSPSIEADIPVALPNIVYPADRQTATKMEIAPSEAVNGAGKILAGAASWEFTIGPPAATMGGQYPWIFDIRV
jgi:hypothetical protein